MAKAKAKRKYTKKVKQAQTKTLWQKIVGVFKK